MPQKNSQPRQNFFRALGFVGTVMVVFTIGYRVAGWNWSDSIYMVVITAFSVGYGEVVPINDPYLRAWTVGLIVLGCTGIILVSGTLVQWLTEAQIQLALGSRRMENEIERLKGHTIICGYGRIGRMIAAQLDEANIPYVILDQNPDRVVEAREAGHLVMNAEATEESALRSAGIVRAKVLATVLPNDAANVFITLSARNLNPAISIIARGEEPSTERKLLQAGANKVVLPAYIGADRIAHLIIHPNSAAVLDEKSKSRAVLENHLTELGLHMAEIEINPDSPWAMRNVGDIEREGAGRLLAVAIQRKDGANDLNPIPTAVLMPGDVLVVMQRALRVTAMA